MSLQHRAWVFALSALALHSSTQSSPRTTYHGSCHCGAIKFSVALPEIKVLMPCGCSICKKKRYLLLLPKDGDHVKIESGEESITSYQFGRKTWTHSVCSLAPIFCLRLADTSKFCSICGTALYGSNNELPTGWNFAVNVGTPALQLSSLTPLGPNFFEFRFQSL
jgi:hypothetical protein